MAKTNDPLDYYFPDTENVSLLESKPPDSSTYQPGFISACLLALVTASCLIIGWILYARDRSSFILAFFIITTIAFLASLFLAFVLLKALTFARQSQLASRSHDIDFIAFIIAVCFAAFFLVAGFSLFLYRPNHFNALNAAWADKSIWESQVGGDFDEKWTEGRRLIMALGFLSLGAFILLAISAMSLYANHPSKYGLTITLLYLSLLIALVFALAAISDYLFLNSLTIGSESGDFSYLLVALLIFSIVAVVLLLLNAIFGLFMLKSALLIFGFLLIILALTGLFIAGNFARGVRKTNDENTFELGRKILTSIHQQDLIGICEKKYLDTNIGCRKEDSSVNWEDNNGSVLPLNVGCYYPAASWYSFIQIRFLMFLLFAIIFTFLAAAMDFALAKSEGDSESKGQPLLPLLIFLGIMLAALIAFSVVFIFFRSSFEAKGTIRQQNSEKVSSFRPVPESLNSRQLNKEGCAQLGEMDLFQLAKDGYYRVALLGQGLSFGNTSEIKRGNLNTRTIFFDDWNSKNDYLLTFGTKIEVENALNNLNVCFVSPSLHKRFYVFAELLENQRVIDSQGMKSGEKLTNSESFVPNGRDYNETLAYSKVLNCSPTCKTSYNFNNPDNNIKVIGHMLVKNLANEFEFYGVPEAEENLSVYFGSNASIPVTYKNNGDFEFNAYSYPAIEQTATLRLKDNNGYYLENFVDIKIPPREQLENTFDVGAIQLLTPDGKGCKNSPALSVCYKNASLQKGKLTVSVRNGVTNEFESVEVSLHKYNSITGPLISSPLVDSENFSMGNLDFGPYLLKPVTDKFFQLEQKVSLQAESLQVNLILIPLPEAGVHRFFSKIPLSQIDYDMNLEFENSQGAKCYVNPQNKYCGYARMIQDIRKGQQGFEILDIEKFTDSNYILYIAPAPFYSGTCPAYEASQSHRKLSTPNQNFKFRKLDATSALTSDDIQFGIFNSDSQLSSDNTANSLNVFTNASQFPSDQVLVINNGFQPILASLVVSITNKYKGDNQKQLESLSNITTNNQNDANVVLSTLKQTNPEIFKQTEVLYQSKIDNYEFKEVPIDIASLKIENITSEQVGSPQTIAEFQTNQNQAVALQQETAGPSTNIDLNASNPQEKAPTSTTSEGNPIQNISTSQEVPSNETETQNATIQPANVPAIVVASNPLVSENLTCADLNGSFFQTLKTDLNIADNQIANIEENIRLKNVSPHIGFDDNAITEAITTVNSDTVAKVKSQWIDILSKSKSLDCPTLTTQISKLLYYIGILIEVQPIQTPISETEPKQIIVVAPTPDKCNQIVDQASEELLKFQSLQMLKSSEEANGSSSLISQIKEGLAKSIQTAPENEITEILQRLSFYQNQAIINGCPEFEEQTKVMIGVINSSIPKVQKEKLCEKLRLKLISAIPLINSEIITKTGLHQKLPETQSTISTNTEIISLPIQGTENINESEIPNKTINESETEELNQEINPNISENEVAVKNETQPSEVQNTNAEEVTTSNIIPTETIQKQIDNAVQAKNEACLYRCSNLQDKLRLIIPLLQSQIKEKAIDKCSMLNIENRQKFEKNGLASIFNYDQKGSQETQSTNLKEQIASLSKTELATLLTLTQNETEDCALLKTKFERISNEIVKIEVEAPKESVEKCQENLNKTVKYLYQNGLSTSEEAQNLNIDKQIEEFESRISSKSDSEVTEISQEFKKQQLENAQCTFNLALLNSLSTKLNKTTISPIIVSQEEKLFKFKERAQEIVSKYGINIQVFEENTSFKPVSSNKEIQQQVEVLTEEQQSNLKNALNEEIISKEETGQNIKARASGIVNLINFQIKEKNAIISETTSQNGGLLGPSSTSVKTNVLPTGQESKENPCSPCQKRVSAKLESLKIDSKLLQDNDEDSQSKAVNDFKVNITYVNQDNLQNLSDFINSEITSLDPSCNNLKAKLELIKALLADQRSQSNILLPSGVNNNISSAGVRNEIDCSSAKEAIRQDIQDLGISPDVIVPSDENVKVNPDQMAESFKTLTEQQRTDLMALFQKSKEENPDCQEFRENLILAFSILNASIESEEDEATVCKSYAHSIDDQLKQENIDDKGIIFGSDEEKSKQAIAALNSEQIRKLLNILKANEDNAKSECPILLGKIQDYERLVALWYDNRNQTYEILCFNLQKRFRDASDLSNVEVIEKNAEKSDLISGVVSQAEPQNIIVNQVNNAQTNTNVNGENKSETEPTTVTNESQFNQPSGVANIQANPENVFQSQTSQCCNLKAKLSQIPSLISIKINESLLIASNCTEKLENLKAKLAANDLPVSLLQTSFADKAEDDKELHSIIFQLTNSQREKLIEILSAFPVSEKECGSLVHRTSNIKRVVAEYSQEPSNDTCKAFSNEFNSLLETIGLDSDSRLALVQQESSLNVETATSNLIDKLNQLSSDQLAQFQNKLENLKNRVHESQCSDLIISIDRVNSLVAYFHNQQSANKTINISSEVNGEKLSLEQEVTPKVLNAGIQAEGTTPATNEESYNFREKLSNLFKDINIQAIVKESPSSQKCFFCQQKIPEAVSGLAVQEEANKACNLTFNENYELNCEGQPDQSSCLSLKAELSKFKIKLANKNCTAEERQKIQEELKDILMNFYHNDYCFRAQDKLVKFINLYMEKVNEINKVSEEDLEAQINSPTVQESQNSQENVINEQKPVEETPSVEPNPPSTEGQTLPATKVIPDEATEPSVQNESEQNGQETILKNEPESQNEVPQEPKLTSEAIQGISGNLSEEQNSSEHVEASEAHLVAEVQSNPVTALPDDKFVLLNCFTGFGKRSFKTLNRVMKTKPGLDLCKKIFESSKYSLDNLLKQMPPLNN